MTIEIPLSKTGKVNAGKYTAIIDDCDADLAELNWAKLGYRNMYAQRMVLGKGVLMHRIVLERTIGRMLNDDEFVDHVNSNGLDNRRENLRIATQAQNTMNQKKRSSSTTGYKGVHYRKQKRKYVAYIKVLGKTKQVGSFDNPEEAHKAYCEAAIKYYGEFARFQ